MAGLFIKVFWESIWRWDFFPYIMKFPKDPLLKTVCMKGNQYIIRL